MQINLERFLDRLDQLYACGAQSDGTHTRMAFSREDCRGRQLFTDWSRSIGMSARTDAAGNLILRQEGAEPALPALVLCSHLDTVPDGGKYDGTVGCVGALEVCQTLRENGVLPRHPVEIVVFTDEEGFRFGKGLVGSAAFSGEDPAVTDEDKDIYGNLRGEVMRSYAIRSGTVTDARREARDILCAIELHIEQGARLDRRRLPVGVVSAIAGVARYDLKVVGEANHAGSTAMADRKDALVAAAGFICRVPEVVKACGNEYTVATVGTIRVTPHSVNVIPGTCEFSLEIRDQSQAVMDLAEARLRELFETQCAAGHVSGSFVQTSTHKPAPLCDWVRAEIQAAVGSLGYENMTLPSGAFHDSLLLAPVFPTGMIFVPSVGGLSHCPEEFTRAEDLMKGVMTLLETVQRVDRR